MSWTYFHISMPSFEKKCVDLLLVLDVESLQGSAKIQIENILSFVGYPVSCVAGAQL